MKKKNSGLKKLDLNKQTIAALQSKVLGGNFTGITNASMCHSCMSECLCNPQPSGGTPCCPMPTRQEQ